MNSYRQQPALGLPEFPRRRVSKRIDSNRHCARDTPAPNHNGDQNQAPRDGDSALQDGYQTTNPCLSRKGVLLNEKARLNLGAQLNSSVRHSCAVYSYTRYLVKL